MKLRYDGVGYAHCDGHWIRKPLTYDQNFGVYSGSHPHDPDGESDYIGTFKTEDAAINCASERYVEWLKKELKRLKK